MATIKEIAEIVGVSSAAVSRVLNYSQNRKCRASVLHRSGR